MQGPTATGMAEFYGRPVYTPGPEPRYNVLVDQNTMNHYVFDTKNKVKLAIVPEHRGEEMFKMCRQLNGYDEPKYNAY